MTENNNKLSEEELTKAAGGMVSGSQMCDEVMRIMEKCLIESKNFFSQENQESFPEVKNLRMNIENAYITAGYDANRINIEQLINSTDKLIANPAFSKDKTLSVIKDRLLQVQEIIGKTER